MSPGEAGSGPAPDPAPFFRARHGRIRREGWTPNPAGQALDGEGTYSEYPAIGTAWTDDLHTSMKALKLTEIERRDLTRIADVLRYLAPKAHARLLYAFERIVRSSAGGGGVREPDQLAAGQPTPTPSASTTPTCRRSRTAPPTRADYTGDR